MNNVVTDFSLEPDNKDRIAYLVGPEDENLKQIDKRLGVKITYSGAHFHIEGAPSKLKRLRNQLKAFMQIPLL